MPKLKPPFKLNVPMLLTWMRIAMIPLVIDVDGISAALAAKIYAQLHGSQ